jgi:hypothetical protein
MKMASNIILAINRADREMRSNLQIIHTVSIDRSKLTSTFTAEIA